MTHSEGIAHEISDSESLVDKETDAFKDFIKKNKCTADQMREAYYRLIGVSESETVMPSVELILTEMRRMVANKFPLNRFASLIESKQDYEDGVPEYHAYVDTLEISESEKSVLRSIIDDKKQGEVSCLVGSKKVGEFRVNVVGLTKSIAVAVMLNQIRKILATVPRGKRYEFTFSEL